MSENKVIPFPAPPKQSAPDSDYRIIFKIGRRRFAYDFRPAVTELNPEPAPIMPFAKSKWASGKKPTIAINGSRRRS